MVNLSLESPARRRGPGPSNLSSIQVPSSARDDSIMYSPLTPDSKRRRYNNYSTNNGRRVDIPYYVHRRDSLPPIQPRYSPPNTATMHPPRTPRDMRRGSVDLNVMVPNQKDQGSSQYDQSRSVEAMVMSVPYAVKIKVLGRITPPLKDPGPTSPAVKVRGAIIAIEGDDAAAVQDLTRWLNNFLSKDQEYAPIVEKPPQLPAEDVDEVSFEEYLDLIQSWHRKSKQMIKYITNPLHLPTSSASTSDDEDARATSVNADKPATPPTPSQKSPVAKPVIILPTYQLGASDAYASKIPIQDVYSPMDHWQWVATLWRGTVGPDLTIYVRNHGTESKEGGTSISTTTASANAPTATHANANSNAKLVDLSEEARCLAVTRDKDGRFADAALRRVGFEVGEWVRGVCGEKAG